jgi:hypothetical protein
MAQVCHLFARAITLAAWFGSRGIAATFSDDFELDSLSRWPQLLPASVVWQVEAEIQRVKVPALRSVPHAPKPEDTNASWTQWR